MEKPLENYCIYHREGKCYFIVSKPSRCRLCFNFVSFEPKVRSKYRISKEYVTLYDIIKEDKTFRALFPEEGDRVQTTLGF
ncbi:MAG: hypothetical protein ACP5G5_02005 [Thermoplasmata archaeon]|jgi:hypothetical protein|nr:hypothetical protein [Thermoplasmatales archaeon]